VHVVAKTGDTPLSEILLSEEFWMESKDPEWRISGSLENHVRYRYLSTDCQAEMAVIVNERSNEVKLARISYRPGERDSHDVYFETDMEYQKYPPCVLQFHEVFKA
jgi:hypothetical protein